MALAKPQDREAQAGTSTELTDSGDASSSTPLAQHPSTLLTGGNEPHLRKPLGTVKVFVSKRVCLAGTGIFLQSEMGF